MSDIGKVRIRVPSTIKAGDVVRVRTLVIHPMERVERDSQGQVIRKAYRYITRMVVSYLGRTAVEFDLTQSVSENPFFSFAVVVTDPGPLTVTFLDTTGARYQGTVDIRFS
jgi:sulfur-oxidizing protein SoxZ